MGKCNHYFSNLQEDCKIDNVKCDNCGMTYYQFILQEIVNWKNKIRQSHDRERALNELIESYKRVNQINAEHVTHQSQLIKQHRDRERVLRDALEFVYNASAPDRGLTMHETTQIYVRAREALEASK
jgi:protein-arginine kinase activator protein McsA